jgi:hypothetical protein
MHIASIQKSRPVNRWLATFKNAHRLERTSNGWSLICILLKLGDFHSSRSDLSSSFHWYDRHVYEGLRSLDVGGANLLGKAVCQS